MTYVPLKIELKYARRGDHVQTSWTVPAGWPDNLDTTGPAPFRRLVLGIEKRTRAGSTGQIRWDLFEVKGDDFSPITRGAGTVAELEAKLEQLHLAI